MRIFIRFFRIYGIITLLLLVLTRIYALFSHGVSSLSMELMFLPVLIGGIIYFWIDKKTPKNVKVQSLYTWFTYTFHTAVVLMVNRMLVTGILYIAGTDTDKLFIFDASIALFSTFAIFFLFKIGKISAR